MFSWPSIQNTISVLSHMDKELARVWVTPNHDPLPTEQQCSCTPQPQAPPNISMFEKWWELKVSC